MTVQMAEEYADRADDRERKRGNGFASTRDQDGLPGPTPAPHMERIQDDG